MNVYDSLMKGLNEAVQYEKGKLNNAKIQHIKKDEDVLEKYAIMKNNRK